MERNMTIFFITLVVFAIGGSAVGIAYNEAKETERMTACVKSGQSWRVNDKTRQMECVK